MAGNTKTLEWFLMDLKYNFHWYNKFNIGSLNLNISYRFSLYKKILKKVVYYIKNYRKQKFIFLPSLIVNAKNYPKDKNYVYCGGGRIVISNKFLERQIRMKIDTSFLPIGVCFFSLESDRFCDAIRSILCDDFIHSLMTDEKTVAIRDLFFLHLTRELSIFTLNYVNEKVNSL